MQTYYEYEWDAFYCYPNSQVLRNKLNITQAEQLHTAGREITSLRMAQLLHDPPSGTLDFEYLKHLHRSLFGDLYDWAGQTRTVNISKGSLFCHAPFIDAQCTALFHQLQSEHYLARIDSQSDLGHRLACYLSELNAIHPFREGNGRTQRLFIEILCQRIGYSLRFERITGEEMIAASHLSFPGKMAAMIQLIEQILEKLPEE